MGSFGKSFEQAFNPAFQQGLEDYNEKIRQTLLNKQRMEEEQRARQQALIDQLNTAGLPVPYAADGKTLNDTAAMGALGDLERKREALKPFINRGPQYAQYGIDASSPDAEQQLLKKQEAEKLSNFDTERRRAAEISAAASRAKAGEDEITDYLAATGIDPTTEHLSGGRLNAAGLKALRDAKARGNLTQTQRNTENAVELGVKAGYIQPGEEDEARAMFSQQLMGRAPNFPQSEREAAVGNAKYLQSLDALRALVQESAGSGRDDFGPIINPLKRAVGSATGLFPEARSIEQVYKEAGAMKAFGEGGRQLTKIEKELTFGQIGSPTDDDFPARLDTHMDRVRNFAELQLERLKASPHKFTAEGRAAIGQLEKALAGKTGGAESVTKAGPSLDDRLAKYRKK